MGIKKSIITYTFCHRKPERSFFLRGKQFPVCARCTGIHIGYLSFPIFLLKLATIDVWWTLALITPTIIDGWTQAKFNRESNNTLRAFTGFLAGVGAMSLVAIIGQFIGSKILQIFHHLK